MRAAVYPLSLMMALVACRGEISPSQDDALPAHAPAEAEVHGPPGPTAPLMDGRFDDWQGVEPLAVDPVGDASGNFDLTRLHATSRGTQLYVHFDNSELLNLYSGPTADGSLQLVIGLPDGAQLRIDFRERSATVDGANRAWHALGLVAAPTHAGNAFELRVDMGVLGVELGDQLSIGVAGSDEIAAQPFVLQHPEAKRSIGSLARIESSVRIASLNTHEAGLVHAVRGDAIHRLLRATAADIYCLQELGQTPATAIASRLALTDGGSWNVHAVSGGSIVGNAVASKHALIPIPNGSARFAGAVVLLDEPIAVFSVHFKCCGYLGSSEDGQRLADALILTQTIGELQRAALGDELTPYADAPVVVFGDFNDVGSPMLEGMLSRQAELDRWMLQHLGAPEVFTWGSEHSAFPPSLLDLLLHSRELTRRKGFVLDTRQLDDAALGLNQLRQSDSLASDHLLMVADFRAP
jgi:endonuclease/exonuclease/phosphatase family metal-dependent hydrolase